MANSPKSNCLWREGRRATVSEPRSGETCDLSPELRRRAEVLPDDPDFFDPTLDWQRVKPMWAAIRLIDPASVAQEEPSLSDRSWEAICGGAKSKCKVQFACTAK
jgi:hypothetical protein